MNQLLERIKTEHEELLLTLKSHNIPDKYPNTVTQNLSCDTYLLRSFVIREQGFCLVSKNWVSKLAKWIGDRKCVELMAGCGSLTYALQQEGVDVIATDNFSWGNSGSHDESWVAAKNYWTEIENIDCIEAIEKYKDTEIFIMSWAYMDDTAYRALLKMREINPNALMVFIGEGKHGCTANDDFYDAIQEIDDINIYKINTIFPSWRGIYDRLFLVK